VTERCRQCRRKGSRVTIARADLDLAARGLALRDTWAARVQLASAREELELALAAERKHVKACVVLAVAQ
jgi:hypothetical protein